MYLLSNKLRGRVNGITFTTLYDGGIEFQGHMYMEILFEI